MGIYEIISTAIAVISGTIAIIAVRQAHKANTIAQHGNEIALVASETSKGANEIAREANTLSLRALSFTEDESCYFWQFEFEREKGLLSVVNYSHLPALNVTIFVTVKGFKIRRFENQEFTAGEIRQFEIVELAQDCIDARARSFEMAKLHVFQLDEPSEVIFLLAWESPSGSKHATHFTKKIR
ncbi:hypothetical protein RQN30_02370 [Arcanobacterium hippocoleae]